MRPVLLLVTVLVTTAPAQSQQRGGQPAPATAKASAPIDLTGYWVSIVSEDWRIRMITPQKGDHPGIPINAAARRIADAWDPAKDEAMSRYLGQGAAGEVRQTNSPGGTNPEWRLTSPAAPIS